MIEGYAENALENFGGIVSFTDAADVPRGCSPFSQNVQFPGPGQVRTRDGFTPPWAAIEGNPDINGLATFITLQLVNRPLIFTSNGELWREEPAGFLELISDDLALDSFMSSYTAFGRHWIAIYNDQTGGDLPRSYDDTTLYRVSQVGPGSPPTAADGAAGNITAGVHKVVMWFETATGYWTKPSPIGSWTAAGSKKVDLTNCWLGPSNVIRRVFAFTAAGGSAFYTLPRFVIEDNTTLTATFDFTDTELLAGENVDAAFNLIELPEQISVTAYKRRLVWTGERNRMTNWNNLTFDGGFNSNLPLGWTAGAGNAGGSKESTDVAYGFSYKITGDGATATRGEITQSAVTEAWFGAALIERNTSYSVRVRAKRSSGLVAGRLNIDLKGTGVDTDGLQVTAATLTEDWTEYTGVLTTGLTTIPSDLTLRVFADQTPTNAQYILVDEIAVFPTVEPFANSVVRISGVDDPESYDGVTGFLDVEPGDGYPMRTVFWLRDFLYLVKTGRLYVTSDYDQLEPSLWPINLVSSEVGTFSPHGVGIGEDWVVIASRNGLYRFDGGTPIKISQEISDSWETINWEAADKIWVKVDTTAEEIHIGVPTGDSTDVNLTLLLDYKEGWEDPRDSGGVGRKWSFWTKYGNAAAMITRKDRHTARFQMGGIGDGLVYELTPFEMVPGSGPTDNGVAFASAWRSHFMPETSSRRNLFGYVTVYAYGQGDMFVYGYFPHSPEDTLRKYLFQICLETPGVRDIERMIQQATERMAVQFEMRDLGGWFVISKAAVYTKQHPLALRGKN